MALETEAIPHMIPRMDKFIAVGMLVRTVAGGLLYRRFLKGMAAIVLLTIMAGVIASTLVIGALLISYYALVNYGVDASTAVLGIMVTAAVILALLVFLMLRSVRSLRKSFLSIPGTRKMNRIVEAFMEGFRSPASADRKL